MINKKLIFTLFIIIGLLAISAVSASDGDVDDFAMTEEIAIGGDNLMIEEISDDSPDNLKEPMLGAKDNGTFIALQEKIEHAGAGSTITLENDYINDNFTEGTTTTKPYKKELSSIKIDKALTIDGRGHSLNANHLSLFFNISASNVVLKNITFLNGYNQGDGAGAIYNTGSNFKIVSCRFENCFDGYYAWDGYMGSGGAIYSFGDNFNVIDSTFINNSVGVTGRPFFVNESDYVFTIEGYGGAIYSVGNNFNLMDSTFIDNAAGYDGGSIYLIGQNCNILNSTFLNNSAVSDDGGAIYVGSYFFYDYGEMGSGKINIINSTFINNSAIYGGAFTINNGYCYIFNSTFHNNSAYGGGAVVVSTNSDYTNNIINSTFTECYAEGEGGAIILGGKSTILNSRFVSNSVNSSVSRLFPGCGGAIYSGSSYNIDILNSTFINNTGAYGGSVYSMENNNLTIRDSNFSDGAAELGSEIFSNNSTCNFINSKFLVVNGSKCAIYENITPIILSNITVDDYNYQKIMENINDHSQIYLTDYTILHYEKILYRDNAVFDGRGNVLEGKIDAGFRISGENIIIKNAIFKSIKFTILADNCTFINCSFVNCTRGGISIRSSSNHIRDCSFINSSNSIIGIAGGSDNSIEDCIFMDCYPLDVGGVSSEGSATTVSGGGQIYGTIYINGPSNKVDNCSFINCSSKLGGAIYIVNSSNMVNNCSFMDCYVKVPSLGFFSAIFTPVGAGGAIALRGSNNLINNSSFIHCYIRPPDNGMYEAYGGAIYEDGIENLIFNCSFINCSAKNAGSGIYSNSTNSSLFDSYFYACNLDKVRYMNVSNISYYTAIDILNMTIDRFSVFLNVSYWGASAVIPYINSSDAVVNVSGGKIRIENLTPGNYSLNLTSIPYEFSSPFTLIVPITIDKLDPIISIIQDSIMSAEIAVMYDEAPIESANITYTIGNETKSAVLEKTSLTVDYLSGNLTIKVKFEGNNYYNPCESVKTLEFNNPFDHGSGNGSANSSGNGTSPGGDVTNGTDYNDDEFIEDNDDGDDYPEDHVDDIDLEGNGTNPSPDGNETGPGGNNTSPEDNATTPGDNGTSPHEDDTTNRKETRIIYSNMETGPVPKSAGRIGNYFVVKLVDDNSIAIAGVPIKIGFNGVIYNRTTDSEGGARLQINLAKEDLYTFAICFLGDDEYNASFEVAKIDVNKKYPKPNKADSTTTAEKVNKTQKETRLKTSIIYSDMVTESVLKVDGRAGKYFTVKLVDNNKKALTGVPIKIGFNGVIYNRTTNASGQARLQINLAKVTLYTFAIAYLGDEKYQASFAVAKIAVNKHTPKLTAPAKTFKASAKTKTVTATLKSKNGNVIKGKKISFTVNGKTYTATTNAKGVASVKVSLSKKGTFIAIAKFAGDASIKATNTKFVIKIS